MTPRERGQMIGYAYAKAYEGELDELQPVAEGEVPDDLKAGIANTLVEPDDEKFCASHTG